MRRLLELNYPLIEIDIKKIRDNAYYIVDYCSKYGIEVMGVAKGVCAFIPIVKAMQEGGIKKFGDSRIQNIKVMREAGIREPIYQLRLPMLSEVEDVIYWTDGSLISEVETIKALSEKAQSYGKVHKIILMVEVGDLREGVMPDDVLSVVGDIIGLPAIKFEGLGTNVGCYGGVLPSFENTKILVVLATDIEKRYGIKVNTISGGTTNTLALFKKGEMAPGINQFRLGYAILLGVDNTNFQTLPKALENTIRLKTEVVELKVKPSYPIGEIGEDAFGNIPVHEDRGPIKRAIVALGKQDCRIEGLFSLDESIKILGASSDHLLLDVTESDSIRIGSIIEFSMSYGAMLSLMTSKYVKKVIV